MKSSVIRRLRQALAAFSVVVGLTVGGASVADAQVWNFSYSGSGMSASSIPFNISVVGTFTATFDVNNVWQITSVTGMRNGDQITGLWPNAPSNLVGPDFGNPNLSSDTLNLEFVAGGTPYDFQWGTAPQGPGCCGINGVESLLVGPNPPGPDYRYFTNAEVTPVAEAVPEINASVGLEALAILFAFGLIMREMLLRGRTAF